MGVFDMALQAVGLQRPPPELCIAALWVYPIKGCRGCKVTSALVETIGFPLDRYWMIVTEVEGRFVTQRQEPKLALIATKLPETVWLEGSESNADAALTMQAPGMPDIKVRLYEIQQRVSSIRFSNTLCWHQVPLTCAGEPRWLSVRCHDWKGQALDQGQHIADWLSNFLQQRVRLVKYGGTHTQSAFALLAQDAVATSDMC